MRACDVRGSRYRVCRQVGGWIAEPGERKVQVRVQVMGTKVCGCWSMFGAGYVCSARVGGARDASKTY